MSAPKVKCSTVNHMGCRNGSVLAKFGTTTDCVISHCFAVGSSKTSLA